MHIRINADNTWHYHSEQATSIDLDISTQNCDLVISVAMATTLPLFVLVMITVYRLSHVLDLQSLSAQIA